MKLYEEKIKKELIRLWTGELAAVLLFWIYFFIIKGSFKDTDLIIIIYPLLVLSFILIQGSIYWFILLKRMSVRQFLEKDTGRVYRVLKVLDLILLLLAIPVILMNEGNVFGKSLSILILLFSFVEWINYFVVRLSYSLNPNVLIQNIKNRRLQKSKIAKEIDKL